MGTGELNAGGNPAMDQHPIQGGVESLHATETGISSGLMGHLARMQTLPLHDLSAPRDGEMARHNLSHGNCRLCLFVRL